MKGILILLLSIMYYKTEVPLPVVQPSHESLKSSHDCGKFRNTGPHTEGTLHSAQWCWVSLRTFLPCLLSEQHTLQRLVGCCLPAVGSEDLGNCRAVSHSLRTAETTEADLLYHQ